MWTFQHVIMIINFVISSLVHIIGAQDQPISSIVIGLKS